MSADMLPSPWRPEMRSAGMRVLAAHPRRHEPLRPYSDSDSDSKDGNGTWFYLSEGYQLWRVALCAGQVGQAHPVAKFRPALWRGLTVRNRLSARLVRDGFHALAILPSGAMVAAIPGAIVTCAAGDNEFRLTHRVERGTRPLHLTATPSGRIYWGEYFSNPERHEVHIYASDDEGQHWEVAYTFPRSAIRHVHNILWDRFGQHLWVLTGDEGGECRILRASQSMDELTAMLQGNQQARAVAAVPMRDGLYFATDTPLEKNYIYRLDRAGNLGRLIAIAGSSLCGCRVGDWVLFSTMAEPSPVNATDSVTLYGANCADGYAAATGFRELGVWFKDRWPMKYFQYGNIFLPDGENDSNWLAFTTTAVKAQDGVTHFWQLASANSGNVGDSDAGFDATSEPIPSGKG